MDGDTLASYPYVRVRIACTKCSRKGSYRLARLADKYGADIPLPDLLEYLAGDCRIWAPRRAGLERCGTFFVDLSSPPTPPDLPPAARTPLRVVGGDRK